MRKAIVTFCDENYRPGLEVLVASIRRWNQEIEVLVITNMTEEIEGCTFVPASDYNPDCGAWPQIPIYVTEAFGWVEYDRIIVIQPDMIVVGDLNRILNAALPEFGAVPGYGISPPPQHRGMRGFGDGMMIIKPSIEMRDWILDYNGVGGQEATIQYALENQWACELPYTWNMSKRRYRHFGGSWNMIKDEIIILHYVGEDKPWMENEDYEYRRLNDVWRSYAAGNPIPLPRSKYEVENEIIL